MNESKQKQIYVVIETRLISGAEDLWMHEETFRGSFGGCLDYTYDMENYEYYIMTEEEWDSDDEE